MPEKNESKQGEGVTDGLEQSKKQATIVDVASRAGVSKSTVSRVLRGDVRVSPKAQKAVSQAIEDLHYIPTAAARALRSQPSNNVGLLTRNISTPAYSQLSYLLQRRMGERGYHLIHEGVVNEAPLQEPELLDSLAALKVRGILVASGVISSEDLKKYAERLPLVVVGRPEPDLSLHNVAYDQELHGRLVAEHFYNMGHRRIVVQVVLPTNSVGSYVRSQSTLKWARELGMTVFTVDVSQRVDFDDFIYRVVRGESVTGISCVYDRWMLKTWRELRARGMSVPDDISLFGSDGLLDGVDLFGLSTVRLPVEQVADRAAQVMTDLIERPEEISPGGKPVRELIPGWILPGKTVRAV